MTSVCKLIGETYTQDSLKNVERTKTYREIICEVKSTYASEWHNAKRDGLAPSFTLETALANYQGEELVEYKGKEYAIYRTYERGDRIELYCQKVGGQL